MQKSLKNITPHFRQNITLLTGHKMKKLFFLVLSFIAILFVHIAREDFGYKEVPSKKSVISGKIRNIPKSGTNLITISMVGDMCFDDLVAERMNLKGDEFLFKGYSEYFKTSDFLFGNLETPFTNLDPRKIVKEYHFRSDPRIAGLLKKNGFTALSLANNHMLDSGLTGMDDTIRAMYRYGLGFSGAESSLEKAVKPYFKTVKGIKVGFLAFSKVIPSHDWAAGEEKGGLACAYSWHEKVYEQAIASAKKNCDILVVSVHWGKERVTEVSDDDASTARRMIDAGADMIMGHHPHVVSRMDYYKEKPIFYSLGNFIFTTSNYSEANKTIMARVVVDSDKKIREVSIVPGNIIESAPVPMEGSAKEAFVRRFNEDSGHGDKDLFASGKSGSGTAM